MRKTTTTAVAAAFVAGGLIGLLVYAATGLSKSERPVAADGRPAWTEVPWPFAMDQWGRGRGRSRVHAGLKYYPKGATALAIAYNDRCDVVVATAVVPSNDPLIFEPAVLDFLNSKIVMQWAERTLGL